MAHRITLLIFLITSTTAAALTPLWTGDVGYGKTFGFDLLESGSPGQDWVLVTVDPSFGDNRVHVFRAGPGQDADEDLIITEPNSIGYYRQFGTDLASVGDVNGDGYDDFVICAPLAVSSYEDTYPAGFYLYYGGGSTIDGNPDITMLMMAGTFRLIGRGVVGGGDYNGDGYDDFAIAAYDGNTPVALMYYGSATMNSTIDLVIHGPSFWYAHEHTLKFADVNGDGADDLVSSREGTWTDPVKIYLGGASADDVADLFLPRSGSSASIGTGDVNGDVYDDVVVLDGNQVFVYYGGATMDATADLVFDEDPDRFQLHHQSRIEIIRTDPTEAGGDIWVSTSFYDGIVVFDGDGPSTSTPEFAYPPLTSGFLSDPGESFLPMPDSNGDGAQELLIFDTAFDLHIYDDVFFDCDDDGIPDNQEVADGTLGDCDGNGLHDLCEVQVWPILDCNGDLGIDSCQLDELDCDGNGAIDSCEIDEWAARDCDDNGVLDVCETMSPLYDCDDNGVADCWEIAQDGTLDCTGNGLLDICEFEDVMVDCDNNGTPDHCQISWSQTFDCNLDGILDSCQSEEPGTDCDLSGVPDVCEGSGEAVLDCDQNGKVDLCEMEQIEGLDCDGDGWLDACDAEPWSGPCRPAPWIQVYFDEALTVTTVSSDTLPATGTLRVAVRGLPAGMADAIDRFEFTLEPPAGLLPYGGTLPAGAIDLGPGALEWVVVLSSPMGADASGDLVLLEVPYIVTGTVGTDSRIGLTGSSVSEVWTMHPVLHDATPSDIRLLDARSAWIDRSFEDCNHNDRDDAEDIALGESTDLDLNGIPDECQTTGSDDIPRGPTLANARPNPFNPSTTLSFTLGGHGHAVLDVHDMRGRIVRTLANGALGAGAHQRVWDGRNEAGRRVESGVYFVRLRSGGVQRIMKVALLK